MTDTLPVDGRRQRSARSQAAIVDAFLALLKSDGQRPSVDAVANRSGVSVRSIFRHFEDLDSLYAAAVDQRVDAVLASWDTGSVAASGKIADRVDATVEARSKLFEQLANVAPLLEVMRGSNETVEAAAAKVSAATRAQAAATFGAEFKKAGSAKKDLADAGEAAMGWGAWFNMRRNLGMSAARARKAGVRMLSGALR